MKHPMMSAIINKRDSDLRYKEYELSVTTLKKQNIPKAIITQPNHLNINTSYKTID
jgi:hypothetical protein